MVVEFCKQNGRFNDGTADLLFLPAGRPAGLPAGLPAGRKSKSAVPSSKRPFCLQNSTTIKYIMPYIYGWMPLAPVGPRGGETIHPFQKSAPPMASHNAQPKMTTNCVHAHPAHSNPHRSNALRLNGPPRGNHICGLCDAYILNMRHQTYVSAEPSWAEPNRTEPSRAKTEPELSQSRAESSQPRSFTPRGNHAVGGWG